MDLLDYVLAVFEAVCFARCLNAPRNERDFLSAVLSSSSRESWSLSASTVREVLSRSVGLKLLKMLSPRAATLPQSPPLLSPKGRPFFRLESNGVCGTLFFWFNICISWPSRASAALLTLQKHRRAKKSSAQRLQCLDQVSLQRQSIQTALAFLTGYHYYRRYSYFSCRLHSFSLFFSHSLALDNKKSRNQK